MGCSRPPLHEGPLKGILGYEERPLVSVDLRTTPAHHRGRLSTMVVDGTLVKVLAWYDNEWGYVNRMMELAVTSPERFPKADEDRNVQHPGRERIIP